MILYDYWRSSASYRVRIALELMGLEYQCKPINLLAGEHQQAKHMARNPLGRVPVLEHRGQRVTQSGAILEYLDSLSPGLWPTDRIKCRELVDLIACDIHPICNLGIVKSVVAEAGRDIKVEWMTRHMQVGLDALEVLCPTPIEGWAFGRPSMFEIYLVPQIYNAKRWGMDVSQWAKLNEIATTASHCSAFIAAEPRDANR